MGVGTAAVAAGMSGGGGGSGGRGLCYAHQRGHCTRGASCRFSHEGGGGGGRGGSGAAARVLVLAAIVAIAMAVLAAVAAAWMSVGGDDPLAADEAFAAAAKGAFWALTGWRKKSAAPAT